MLPCWRVDVRHERNSGRLGHIRSRPITLTEAWHLQRHYEGHGHEATIECLEDLVALHKRIIAGELTENAARSIGRQRGYDL